MAVSNLPAILDGIAAQLATATGIGNVTTRLPEMPSNDPLIYIVRPRVRRLESTMGGMSIGWTVPVVVATPTGNNDQAEADIYNAAVSIMNVAGHDLDAHETIGDGQWLITSGTTDYGSIGGTPVFAFEFQVEIVEHLEYTPSL